jgi:hypothetical protein
LNTDYYYNSSSLDHKPIDNINIMASSTTSSCIPLIVKWGKETIELNFIIESGVKGLKTELEEATGVPADRMKLMAKSKGTVGIDCMVLTHSLTRR